MWAVAVCKLRFQTKGWSCQATPGLLRRRRFRQWLECHKIPSQKSYAMFVTLTVLPQGYGGFDWKRSNQMNTVPFSVTWRRTGFSQWLEWGWSGNLGMVSVCAVSNTHSSSWILLKTIRHMSQCNYGSSWVPGWNHPHWSNLIFVHESRISTLNCNGHTCMLFCVGEC